MPSRKRDSKRLLVEAARREFGEFGFAGARTDRIAHRAGVNKQLLFYYFGSKAGLFDAVVAEAGTQVERAVTAGADTAHAGGRLRTQLVTVFEALERRPDLTRLVVASPDGNGSARDPVRTLVAELAATISDGQGLGYFRDDADPQLAAQQAVVLLVGYLAMRHAVEPAEDPRGRDRWLDGVCDLLLRSLSW